MSAKICLFLKLSASNEFITIMATFILFFLLKSFCKSISLANWVYFYYFYLFLRKKEDEVTQYLIESDKIHSLLSRKLKPLSVISQNQQEIVYLIKSILVCDYIDLVNLQSYSEPIKKLLMTKISWLNNSWRFFFDNKIRV